MDEFPEHFEEYQVPYSNALQCRRRGGGAYFVGPLARWNINADRRRPRSASWLGETGIGWPCRNPYVEHRRPRTRDVLTPIEEAIRLDRGVRAARAPPSLPYEPRAGAGAWITEAPRGILYHRYEADAAGLVTHRNDHSPHQPEPATDRGRPDPLRAGGARSSRGSGRLALRAGRAELRPLYQLRHPFSEAEGRPVMSVIIGLGSPHGDDQLGWIAIDRLRPLLPAGVVGHKTEAPIDVLDYFSGHDRGVIIDATAPNGHAGSHRSFLWPCPELLTGSAWSTHGVGLVEVLRLAAALGRLPRRVRIETIEAGQTTPGEALSDDVSRGIDSLVEAVLRDLRRVDRSNDSAS